MCSCRGPSACKQGRRIYNTLLLQAMALYIHGPLRCKNLLGRIPNPHSRPALAAPQHAPGPRSDARSQRTPPGDHAQDQQPHTIRPTDSNPARNTRPSHSISRPTWKPCAGALTSCSRARPSPRRWKNSPRWKMIDPHTVRKPARLSNRTGFFFYLLRISPAECPPKPDAHSLSLWAKRGQALWTRPLGQYPPDQTVRGLHPRPAVQHADSPQGIPQQFA